MKISHYGNFKTSRWITVKEVEPMIRKVTLMMLTHIHTCTVN